MSECRGTVPTVSQWLRIAQCYNNFIMNAAHRPAVMVNGIMSIPLASGKGFALVDDDMRHLDVKFWSLSSHGYAVSGGGANRIYLHHMVIGRPPKGMVVDHINRNRLDNRRVNLRIVTQKVNCRNSVLIGKHKRKKAPKGFPG